MGTDACQDASRLPKGLLASPQVGKSGAQPCFPGGRNQSKPCPSFLIAFLQPVRWQGRLPGHETGRKWQEQPLRLGKFAKSFNGGVVPCYQDAG